MDLYRTSEDSYYHFTIRRLVSALNSLDEHFKYEVAQLERRISEKGELNEYYLLFIDRISEPTDSVMKVFNDEYSLQTELIDTLKYANDLFKS